MTSKIYKTAMGKTVDIGALMLQHETIRAVGNMNVNARGDTLDSQNQVVEQKNRQVQRQYNRQTDNISTIKPGASNTAVKKERQESLTPQQTISEDFSDTFADLPEDNDVVIEKTPEIVNEKANLLKGGLASAIARSKEVKQELLKTPRQLAQEQTGVKKI